MEEMAGRPCCRGPAPVPRQQGKAHGAPCSGPAAAGRARLLSLLRPALGGLLWRSSKADVAHELGLPPQVGRRLGRGGARGEAGRCPCRLLAATSWLTLPPCSESLPAASLLVSRPPT